MPRIRVSESKNHTIETGIEFCSETGERLDDIPYCKDCDQLYHVPESLVWTNMKNRKYKQSKVLDSLEIR